MSNYRCPVISEQSSRSPLIRLWRCFNLQNLPWNTHVSEIHILFMYFYISGPDDDEAYEENQVSQEMLEDRLVRLATREVMDLLCECHISINSCFFYTLHHVCADIFVLFYTFFYWQVHHAYQGSCLNQLQTERMQMVHLSKHPTLKLLCRKNGGMVCCY